MITEIRLRNFKNFKDATLPMGPFTVIVGANASGKSNIRDAFRFLHGIGRGYSIADIIGGKYGAGGQLEWPPMRGAVNEIIRFGETGFEIDVKFELPGRADGEARKSLVEYGIGVEKAASEESGFRIASEFFRVSGTMVYSRGIGSDTGAIVWNDGNGFRAEKSHALGEAKIDFPEFNFPTQPGLRFIPTACSAFGYLGYGQPVVDTLNTLGAIRFLDLAPELMRRSSFPGQNVLGDSGENLTAVLREICQDTDRKETLIDWLQELTPMDVIDFEFPRDPLSGLVQLVMKERSGHSVSAYSASDGTLRFLAMLAALLGKNPAALYFFEEIDNGIHPSRLALLLDLIETQTGRGGVQVVTTTHSPDLMTMVRDPTFADTSVVFRAPDTDHAVIRRVADLPNVAKLRAEQGLGRLHASGWLEDMLTLETEDEPAAVP